MKNKIRVFFMTLLLILTSVSALGLISCTVDDVEEISVTPGEISVRIGEFEYADYTVTATYGSGKTESVALNASMLTAADRLKLLKEGEHEITVTYAEKSTVVKVSVRRNVFAGAVFADIDVVYSGEFYVAEVKNVPEGTTVTYPTTNRFRNAGEYEAKAVLRKDAYEMKEMTAKIIIRKADYDFSSVVFEDKTETFDGNVHTLEMTGVIPTGVAVEYTIIREGGKEERGNGARNAGQYVVRASFTGDPNNYNKIEPKEAKLTIEQAVIDLSAITFSDKTEVYDRTRHSVKIDGALPVGVSVTYDNNEHVDAGVYKATATFTVADFINYAAIPSKTAVLTIEKAEYDMSDVHYNGNRVYYDGTEKKIEIQGALPSGVKVTYKNNAGIDAGTYQATATFVAGDKNYNDPAPITATLIIDPVEAQMDRVSFERSRFVAVMKNEYYDDFYDDFYEEDEDDEAEYDPYCAAMAYRPTNVPTGLKIKDVRYCQTAGWVEDLTAYNDLDGYSDAITADGYYVVVVTFEDNPNYVSVSPVRTQIRTTTVTRFKTSEIVVYEDEWKDPISGKKIGVYLDYNYGACVKESANAVMENLELSYCECNVFADYKNGGADALYTPYDADLSAETLEAFDQLAYHHAILVEEYASFVGGAPDFMGLMSNPYKSAYAKILEYSAAASKGSGENPFSFENKPVYMTINGDKVGRHGATLELADETNSSDDKKLLATLFGYSDGDDFIKDATGLARSLFKYKNKAGVSMASAAARCGFKGSIYSLAKPFNESHDVFVLPFKYGWSNDVGGMTQICVYAIVDDVQGGGEISFIINDYDLALEYLSLCETGGTATMYGRCNAFEKEGWKWRPTTVTVIEDGKATEKYLTRGTEISFVEPLGDLDGIEENRVAFRYCTSLPGACSEKTAGYNKDDYIITANGFKIAFCDCNPLGSVIKDDGKTDGVAKREGRGEHAQLSEETVAAFDSLSAYYAAFIANYNLGDSVSNEWKLGTTSLYYKSYKDYFDLAKSLFAKANRNLSRGVEYDTANSVIVGMNKAFTISLNGGASYTGTAYREMIMKLFGFTDMNAFTTYSEALAHELCLNEKNSSAEFITTRALYDGAIYTQNGYFVIPYAIKSERSATNVLAFVFVDTDGNMSVWINDAKNAFAAVASAAEGETPNLEIFGRCLLFEDDGYTMLEQLDPAVQEKIIELKQFSPFGVSSDDETPIAIERIKNMTGTGSFLVYTSLTDGSGVDVKLNSVYNDDPSGDVVDGFYTVLTVIDLEDVKKYNAALNSLAEEQSGDETEVNE